jgi:S1-C subfamily serine protease
MIRSKVRPSVAFVGFATLILGGCTSLPGAPGPGRTDWIPEVTPSALPSNLADNPYGFTPGERAAVRVRNQACNGLADGSGFAIDDHTIVTNRHVVDGYRVLEITTSDGRDITVAAASTVVIADLAVVTTVETLDYTVPLSSLDPALGDNLTVIGYPLGDELATTTGLVLQSIDDPLDNADHVWRTTASVRPGSSGSAAYNDEGDVFGIVFAGEDFTRRSLIIPVSLLERALNDPSLLTSVAPACDV